MLIDVLDDPEAAARNAAGWAICLDQMEKGLLGAQGDGPQSETALAFKPLFDSYVELGFPSSAPIPGLD